MMTEQGELYFESATELNHEKHELQIVETTILKSDSGTHTTKHNVIMRCWTMDELSHRLDRAGFKDVEYFGDYDESIAVGESDRIVALTKLS